MIAPTAQAQQIAYFSHGKKEDEPPNMEDALANFNKWLEADDLSHLSTEDRERAMVWGLHG